VQIVAIGNTTAEDPLLIVPYNYFGVQVVVRGGATAFRVEGVHIKYGGEEEE